jgi:predicted nuclease of restriction endonuclease-like (RecB) superfamily
VVKRTRGSPAPAGRPSAALSVPHDAGVLFDRIATILEEARARVVHVVNSQMVLAYWSIGREIVEHLQRGGSRAEYGDQLVDDLSRRLAQRFGRGFSTTNLRYFRSFYLAYSERRAEIRHLQGGESGSPDSRRRKRHTRGGVLDDLSRATTPKLRGFSPLLGWTHYRVLMKVEYDTARRFYEIEAERSRWSAEQLERQVHTQLFARLLKSRDQAGVLDLASRGQVLERPADVIRNPYVLDFLDLPEAHQLSENDLESAILQKLQHFLLELGKGFAFVARQKRITFEDDHFAIDLVFYNVVLKAYLLIDLKLGKLTHGDVGQMDSYVRLYDEQYRTAGDGPTIGLILCAEKNEAVARYSVLHENRQLFAAKYVTWLPTVEELQRELARERQLLGQSLGKVIPKAAQRAPKLSASAMGARSPRPPEELVGALQDRVHSASGRLLGGKAVRGGRRK